MKVYRSAKYGQANRRKILRMADAMAAEAKARFGRELADWAGLAWIVSEFYNSSARRMCEAMGAAWTTRAKLLCRALDYACRPF